jgi:peroxiredoxin Q/BCP
MLGGSESEEQTMTGLRVGDRAPDFHATTADGRPIALDDYRGRRGLVLFFYPRDHTRICTKQACAFRDSYEQFAAAGFDVVGVSSNSTDSHRDFASQHRLPFPLVSDTDGSLRKAFGVSDRLGLIPRRVTFVIDQQGVIRMVFSAMLASDEHVQRALAAVNSAQGEPGA